MAIFITSNRKYRHLHSYVTGMRDCWAVVDDFGNLTPVVAAHTIGHLFGYYRIH